MLGQLKFDVRGWGGAERCELYGLPVLRSKADPRGWLGGHRLRRAGRCLWRGGVIRTLVPKGFEDWGVLEDCGLVPVDTGVFLRAQSLPLALGALERRGLTPEHSTVALRGQRADREMARAAAQLCAHVRQLVISAPRGGRELADWLRWEFGVAVLPEEAAGQVALRFDASSLRHSAEPALELYGSSPDLGGLHVLAPELGQDDKDDLPLLAALWEGGRLPCEKVKIT